MRWAPGSDEPAFTYEPTGIIDLPPGYRGYGADERVEMTNSIENYNSSVADEQARRGRPATREAQGSALRWGSWKDAS